MGEPTRIRKEMGISHADFFRVLPQVVREREHRVEGRRVEIREDGRRVEIVLSEEQVRSLGLVKLPYTYVELVFHDFDEAQQAAFLADFELQFFRGGG